MRTVPKFAQTAQIVAQQVDNHHVFAAVFGVVAEPLRLGLIFAGGAASGSGSLHGTGGDAALVAVALHPSDEVVVLWASLGAPAFNVEEEFGRKREDAAVGLRMQEGRVRDRLAAEQALIERGGAASSMDAHGNSEVELIDVARANPLVDRLDLPRVFLFRQVDCGFRQGRC